MSKDTKADLAAYQRKRRQVLAIIFTVIGVGLIFVGSAHGELWHERIESIGSMLILIGIGGRLWSTLYIGGRKSAEVVETGPYSIMRNPLYFFSSVAAMGVGAQAGSVILAIAFAVFCWLAFLVVIRREETFLEASFGAPYADYMARVPRFFPNPKLYRDQELVTFQPRLLNRTLVDGLAFFASIPLFELMETLQEAGWLPVLAHMS